MPQSKIKQYTDRAEQALKDNYFDKASAYALVAIALSKQTTTVKEVRSRTHGTSKRAIQ
ncbi:hypothetical protein [Oenococcus sicerae]|uniref:hypothetical protein n=1 Tax=Oenococcus sicerae TaxID=2203724 RepID=UPI002658004D|nr:hypothetical protein [Oenococcus sicerae]